MEKYEAIKLDLYKTNIEFKTLVNEYKNYNTIRKDFRNVYNICTTLISLNNKISEDSKFLEEINTSLNIYRGAMLHAIILYGRWFKSTNNKPTLSEEKYITNEIKNTHFKIMELRDKYIAHQELDLLGGDKVWIHYCDNEKLYSIESTFEEEVFLQQENLNLQNFKKCIEIIHNKIDSKSIPEAENKLKKYCQRNKIIINV